MARTNLISALAAAGICTKIGDMKSPISWQRLVACVAGATALVLTITKAPCLHSAVC